MPGGSTCPENSLDRKRCQDGGGAELNSALAGAVHRPHELTVVLSPLNICQAITKNNLEKLKDELDR